MTIFIEVLIKSSRIQKAQPVTWLRLEQFTTNETKEQNFVCISRYIVDPLLSMLHFQI
jgi:hypothetical protein